MRTIAQIEKSINLKKIHGFVASDYYCRENNSNIIIWDRPTGTEAISIHADGMTSKRFTRAEWVIVSEHLRKRAEAISHVNFIA